jgi:hypothetical protein
MRCFLGLISEQKLLTYWSSIREKEEQKCWVKKDEEAPELDLVLYRIMYSVFEVKIIPDCSSTAAPIEKQI